MGATILSNVPGLSEKDFAFFREQIYELAGISLSAAKLDLVQSRLRNRVSFLGLKNFRAYAEFLTERDRIDPEWQFFINALTTNKTEWFRESEHFEFIRKDFLRAFIETGKKHLRVWCGACSTGEEAYSLSLLLNQVLKDSGVTFEIVASDIDTNVLQVAKNGVYRRGHLSQVPQVYHQSGFILGTEEISDWMKVKKEIKSHITFRQFNLVQFPFDFSQKFDLIVCRNVFIYFDSQTVGNVTKEMFKHAEKDAVLIIAHSESLQNLNTPWTYIGPSVYAKGKVFSCRKDT